MIKTKTLTFQEWLDKKFYKGFDSSELTDDEYWEQEYRYIQECVYYEEETK